ncbi:MAG: Quinone oxidoreductase, partial [uncultured Nocardioidaceae bacterium]
ARDRRLRARRTRSPDLHRPARAGAGSRRGRRRGRGHGRQPCRPPATARSLPATARSQRHPGAGVQRLGLRAGGGSGRLAGRRPRLRSAVGGRVRRARERSCWAADAGAGRARRPDRGRAPRGGLHGVVERRDGGAPPAPGDAPRPRRSRRHRHLRRPAGACPGIHRHRHRRLGREAGCVPAARGGRGGELPRAGLRRGGPRGDRRPRSRRHPRQHGCGLSRAQRRRARSRGAAGGHRDAGRLEGRARSRAAPRQARCGHRHRAAVAPDRPEGRDLRGGPGAGVAAGRGRRGRADRARPVPALRGSRGARRGGGRQEHRQGPAHPAVRTGL